MPFPAWHLFQTVTFHIMASRHRRTTITNTHQGNIMAATTSHTTIDIKDNSASWLQHVTATCPDTEKSLNRTLPGYCLKMNWTAPQLRHLTITAPTAEPTSTRNSAWLLTLAKACIAAMARSA